MALSSYPDWHFVDSLVAAIKYGVHLGVVNVHMLRRSTFTPPPLPLSRAMTSHPFRTPSDSEDL
jgi:hypothetical protein